MWVFHSSIISGKNAKGLWVQQREILVNYLSNGLNFRPLNPESEITCIGCSQVLRLRAGKIEKEILCSSVGGGGM